MGMKTGRRTIAVNRSPAPQSIPSNAVITISIDGKEIGRVTEEEALVVIELLTQEVKGS
jgi:hypothetical protein